MHTLQKVNFGQAPNKHRIYISKPKRYRIEIVTYLNYI